MTVGSGPEAGWNVSAPGVAPVHFELYWDGSSLWVSPPMAGTLTVDGERVQSWRQLAGRARIEFGQAAMMVESSQSVGLAAPVAASAAAPSAGYLAPGDDSTLMAPMPTGELDLHELAPIAGESTMIFDGDAEGFDLEGESTRMVDPTPAAPAGRPGFGGVSVGGAVGGGIAPPARPAAPTLSPFTLEPPTGGGGGMKTQILDTSDLGLGDPFGDQTRPPLAASQATTDVLPRPLSAPPGPSAAATGKFALPPSGADVAGQGKPKLALPPTRTLILLGVTLVIALGGLGLILWRKSQRQAEAAQAMQQAAVSQSSQAEAAAAAVRARIEQTRVAQQEVETRLMAAAEPRITSALAAARTRAEAALPRDSTPEATAAALATAERTALEALGIEALGTNDYTLSFACFQRLAREHPGGPYAAMLPILRAKLPCTGGVGPDGRPCTR